MRYPLLRWIVQQEGADFQRVENRWRPMHLLYLQQVQLMLHDMERRYEHLSAARDELQTLDRADRYIKHLIRMRLWLRQAFYTWKANQLAFLQATAGFYTEYGAVLRLLKIDHARGRLADRAVTNLKEGV